MAPAPQIHRMTARDNYARGPPPINKSKLLTETSIFTLKE